MDDKLKRDIKVIQMRNYMDPKRFYKNVSPLAGKRLSFDILFGYRYID